MLCSVVKHLGSGDSPQEIGRNTRVRLVLPLTLLSCYHRFLRALQQNRVQSRLLYLLIKKWTITDQRTRFCGTKSFFFVLSYAIDGSRTILRDPGEVNLGGARRGEDRCDKIGAFTGWWKVEVIYYEKRFFLKPAQFFGRKFRFSFFIS